MESNENEQKLQPLAVCFATFYVCLGSCKATCRLLIREMGTIILRLRTSQSV